MTSSTPNPARPADATAAAAAVGRSAAPPWTTGAEPTRRRVLGLSAAGAAAGIAVALSRPSAAEAAQGPTDGGGGTAFSTAWEETFEGTGLDPRSWELELGTIRGNEQ